MPVRPFLKWAGNKFELTQKINTLLPPSKTLVEPFVGSGALFLNSNYENYILADINCDLINLYISLQSEGAQFIVDAREYFSDKTNTEKKYYFFRNKFNSSADKYEKALLFLYLNRHCYNGLCRYNQSGIFNVPFGKYKAPYFPEKELHLFYVKSKSAIFKCESFLDTFKRVKKNSAVYCDPPYVPLSDTSNFTSYSTSGFTLIQQEALAIQARKTAHSGIPVLISNHDTSFVRKVYKGAKFTTLTARRRISCNTSKRGNAKEILAMFS